MVTKQQFDLMNHYILTCEICMVTSRIVCVCCYACKVVKSLKRGTGSDQIMSEMFFAQWLFLTACVCACVRYILYVAVFLFCLACTSRIAFYLLVSKLSLPQKCYFMIILSFLFYCNSVLLSLNDCGGP